MPINVRPNHNAPKPPDARYDVGQVWAYHTREGEEASRLWIVYIDRPTEDLADAIYHIYLDNMKIVLPGGGLQTEFPHLPVNHETLDASVTMLVADHAPLPDIAAGYNQWRQEFDAGRAGVFNIPVVEIVRTIAGGIAPDSLDA